MCPWRGFLQGIHGTAQGRSNLPLHSKISTKAPELFQSSISNISIRTRGKKLPRGGYRAKMCPEGLEMRRKSSSPREGRLSIQPSWKWGDLGPMLQHFVRAVFVLPLLYLPRGYVGSFLLSSYQFASLMSA